MLRTLASLTLAGAVVLTPSIAGAQDTPVAETTQQSEGTDVRPDKERPDRDRVRFACKAHRSDRGPVIGCKWSRPDNPRVAGYRLWRIVDDGPRKIVYQTRNLRANGHRDLVRPGHTYRYAVQYLGHGGRVIHTSHVERIVIPPQRPDRAATDARPDVDRTA